MFEFNRGDFNNDGRVNAPDVDLLFDAISSGSTNPIYDLDGSGTVTDGDSTYGDVDELILIVLNTYYGDANLDGAFDSSDFVQVMSSGEYEDSINDNSTWSEGDWNGDDDFTSSDFTLASLYGGYEQPNRGGGAFDVHTLRFGFTGRIYDGFTGLQNNLNRWYGADVGRWLSEDPIGFAAGDANLYRYVGNRPSLSIDPTGLYEQIFLSGIQDFKQVSDSIAKDVDMIDNGNTLGQVRAKNGRPVNEAKFHVVLSPTRNDSGECSFRIKTFRLELEVAIAKRATQGRLSLPMTETFRSEVAKHETIHVDAYQRQLDRGIELVKLSTANNHISGIARNESDIRELLPKLVNIIVNNMTQIISLEMRRQDLHADQLNERRGPLKARDGVWIGREFSRQTYRNTILNELDGIQGGNIDKAIHEVDGNLEAAWHRFSSEIHRATRGYK